MSRHDKPPDPRTTNEDYDIPDDHASHCQRGEHKERKDSRVNLLGVPPLDFDENAPDAGVVASGLLVAVCQHCKSIYPVEA